MIIVIPVVCLLSVGFISSFYLYKYLLEGEIHKIIKLCLILFPTTFAIAICGWYIMDKSLPTSFKAGVDSIIYNDTLISRVGGYESYSYKPNSLPKESDNPAKFSVEINGSKATLFLTCRMSKSTSGDWILTQVKQDSLLLKNYKVPN